MKIQSSSDASAERLRGLDNAALARARHERRDDSWDVMPTVAVAPPAAIVDVGRGEQSASTYAPPPAAASAAAAAPKIRVDVGARERGERADCGGLPPHPRPLSPGGETGKT